MTKLGRLLFCAALLLPTAAYPQSQSSGIAPSAAGKSLSVSSSSSCVAMTQQNTTFVVWNVGSVAAYFNMNGATATTGNPQLPAASGITLNAAPGATLCAITASSTTTLQITQGLGFTAIAGSAGATGSTSDATAANQVLQIAQETAFNTALGLMADAACATDNGTCDVIALLKRGNQRLTTIIAGIPVTNAGTFAVQATIADGADVTLGAIADAAATQGSTGSISAKLRTTTSQLNTLNTTVSLAANQTAIQAPVAPATATATKSVLLGAQATTAAVNPTTGQQGALSSDTNNNLLVSSGGAPSLATSQASITTGNISAASARALRRSITITNVTGTSAVYCGNTGVTTSTGTYLGATAGSSITLNTTAAVFCTVAATTQTVTVAETF